MAKTYRVAEAQMAAGSWKWQRKVHVTLRLFEYGKAVMHQTGRGHTPLAYASRQFRRNINGNLRRCDRDGYAASVARAEAIGREFANS